LKPVFSFIAALIASAALTPLVMWVARRTGMVAKPKSDRWHTRTTALLGGVAVFAAFMIGVVPFLEFPNDSTRTRILGVLIGAGLVFGLGLLDDLVQIRPGSKLIGQIVAACVLVYTGVYFDILGMPLVTIPLTIFFVVGITNAFNLLDNMDGLSSGVAAICLLTLFLFNVLLGNPEAFGVVILALAGALIGFLIFNFNPAKIFLGDSGSLFIGFTVAAISILGTWEQASNTFLILAVPVVVLGVPIFDTTFVTVTRTLAGTPVSQGGRDHTSHRLVRLGMSERAAVLVIYAICIVFSAIAVLSLQVGSFGLGVFAILAVIAIFWFGVFLAHDKLYKPVEGETSADGTLIRTLVMQKMRMAEVLIDLTLFGAAYIAAYMIRFEGDLVGLPQDKLIESLPVVLAVKFVVFFSFGLYRRIWAFTGIHDLTVIGRSILTSTLVSVVLLWGINRLDGYSRTVFVIDAVLLLVFTAGSRVMFRVLREWANNQTAAGRRLLIFGAGVAGELLLREVRSDSSLGFQPVGFIDDDVRKRGRRIHGLKIYGGRGDLGRIVERETVDEIIIAIPSLDDDAQALIQDACRKTGIPCRNMKRVSSTFLN